MVLALVPSPCFFEIFRVYFIEMLIDRFAEMLYIFIML